MEVIWKDIEGYEGYYQVSNDGQVKSLDRYITRSDGTVYFKKGKLMVQTLNTDEYPTVHLSRDGKGERISVHILVAKAFVPGYIKGLEVDHLDTNRENNVYTNLEWVTHEENNRRTFERGHHVSQVKDTHGANNPNYGNHKLHERFVEHPELLALQGRPGSQNGRSVKVNVIFKDGSKMTFGYLREAAKYLIESGLTKIKSLEGMANKITECLKNNTTYMNLSFERCE